MKRKIIIVSILSVLAIILLTFGNSVINLIHNYSLDYEEYVYLGGDNIVIDYKTTSDSNAAAANNEYATIGTLTFVSKDGNYGAVAHKISDTKIESGNIYIVPVDSVIKSNREKIGEKNVIIGYNKANGNITNINEAGIFGKYNLKLNNKSLMPIGMPREIECSKAYVYTVVSRNKIEAYEIEIIKLNYSKKSHNIYFKITDEKLLNKTGGVIKGMSGSPIVQDGKIIGAISHVEDADPTYGYALFITYMI